MYTNCQIYDWIVIFKIYLIWSFNVFGLQAARAFAMGGSIVKTAGQIFNQISKQSAYDTLWAGGTKGTAKCASWFERVTRSRAKTIQGQEDLKTQFWRQTHYLGFSN